MHDGKAKFDIQKVEINNNTDVIMKCLGECLNRNNVTDLPLTSTTSEERSGFKGKMLYGAEYLMDNKYGYTSISLPAAKNVVEPVLKALYDDYITYLNRIYLKTGKKSGDTAKGKIDSRYVLVRELLSRALACALTQEGDLQHGENIMNFMEDFVRGLLLSQVLLDEKFLYHKQRIVAI